MSASSESDNLGPSACPSARQLAFEALKAIYRGGYADVVLHRVLAQWPVSDREHHLATELVYGIVRRQRTLDALIDQLGKKTARQQPLALRIILHIGLYQLRYLSQVPAAAAVNTSVELAKVSGQARLAGVVNGILRQYLRCCQGTPDPLQLPPDCTTAIAIRHSYPDWIVHLWQAQLGEAQTEALCDWLNQPPRIDLRVNPLKMTVTDLVQHFAEAGVPVQPLPGLPTAVRLPQSVGAIQQLPGYAQGWWTVQDASAQLVGHLVEAQPGQVIIDACAAPGGKATHLAELIHDDGLIWACDRTPSRLRRVTQNIQRLGLQSIQTLTADSTTLERFVAQGDRVLVDAPCSGLGTLHRHADARWRHTPASIEDLTLLQARLLQRAATWVKPDGLLVYATCTLHPAENEAQIERFLNQHPDWQILPPSPESPAAPYTTEAGWVYLWPHHHQMDGFFMVRLKRQSN